MDTNDRGACDRPPLRPVVHLHRLGAAGGHSTHRAVGVDPGPEGHSQEGLARVHARPGRWVFCNLRRQRTATGGLVPGEQVRHLRPPIHIGRLQGGGGQPAGGHRQPCECQANPSTL
jgi:hypothetical protein